MWNKSLLLKQFETCDFDSVWNLCIFLVYSYIANSDVYLKEIIISLKLFECKNSTLYLHKSSNLNFSGQPWDWFQFACFCHLQPLRKLHFISIHTVLASTTLFATKRVIDDAVTCWECPISNNFFLSSLVKVRLVKPE